MQRRLIALAFLAVLLPAAAMADHHYRAGVAARVATPPAGEPVIESDARTVAALSLPLVILGLTVMLAYRKAVLWYQRSCAADRTEPDGARGQRAVIS
jgi:hypothetical protein